MTPDTNALGSSRSPYLRQHADNPVHWQQWTPAVLDAAAALDRPIFLSIGYSACHWCHVMAHESFEDAETAELMNKWFVNIKVDREERPDIDQIYMAALTATGVQGGWPLSIFLTPDGRPIWGGTYFPPTGQHGRPSFQEVLRAVHNAWIKDRQTLDAGAARLQGHIEGQLAGDEDGAMFSPAIHRAFARRVDELIDRVRGGISGAPKFPNAPMMKALWLDWLEAGNASARDAVLVTLRRIVTGGIHDHVGGGIARYATDQDWLVPHFEKMLYDNAQLIEQLCWPYAATGDDLFRRRIESTVLFLQRDLTLPGRGLAASFDADSPGGEGAFYTWTRDQVTDAAQGDLYLFDTIYGLATPPGWEGDPILCQTQSQAVAELHHGEAVDRMRERLRQARAQRPAPARDDKVLVDWNGLAIAAVARAGRLLGRRDWVGWASGVYDDVTRHARGGRLAHVAADDAEISSLALSSDYAALALAAFALWQATQDSRFLTDADAFTSELDRWHAAEDRMSHHLTAHDARDVPLRVRGDIDEAVPSATSLVIDALSVQATISCDPDHAGRLNGCISAAYGRIESKPYGQAGVLNACLVAVARRKLVIFDTAEGPLVSVANRSSDPRRVDILKPVSGETDIEIMPGMVVRADRPVAYLCLSDRCLPPVYEAEALAALLTR
jgi:uncharacterized protein YyaL (SSP411 family)